MKDLLFKERIRIRGRNGKSMKLKLNSWKVYIVDLWRI
jgi:hypothetical protein